MKGNEQCVQQCEWVSKIIKCPNVRKKEIAVNDSDEITGIVLGWRQRGGLDRHEGGFGMMEIYILVVYILYIS